MRNLVFETTYLDCNPFADKFFKVRAAIFGRYMWSKTHQAFCPTIDNQSDLETGGLPCQPNSRAGEMLFESDPRFVTYIVFCLMNVYRGTLALILENVKGLKLNIIHALFGMFYWIYVLEDVAPADAGHRGRLSG